jgi:uncharacterized membrane protein YebE (DUF533 family)
MAFGNILGQILQQGLGQAQGGDRLRTTANNMQGAGGGGLDAIFGQIQGALGRAGVDTAGLQQGAGGFADKAGEFIRKDQIGGLSGGQIGGIGALAGALLGGGLGGAARGGAMAMLGTLALTALRNAQASKAGGAATAAPLQLDAAEIEAVTSPATEKLLVAAMISAAKADGQIDKDEMQKIVGRISADSVTAEEKQFVLEQMTTPVDVQALAAQVTGQAQAAQVYAASIMAISADTPAEQAYLRELATALGIDPAAVEQLHKMTGA